MYDFIEISTRIIIFPVLSLNKFACSLSIFIGIDNEWLY
jgi:hypothetical protein